MLKKIHELFKKYTEEKGQGVVEYALILGVVALLATALMIQNGLADKLVGSVDKVGSGVDTAAGKVQTAISSVTIVAPDGQTT